MCLLAISEITIRLSLYRWKALPEQNICKRFQYQFAVVKSQKDEKYALFPKGLVICKI